jgi:hypothetical protein
LSRQVVESGDSFVNCYLPYFRQWLICHLLLAIYFCRLCLLKVHVESSSLFPPPFSGGGACLLATFAGFVYWEFAWRAAPCSFPLLWCTQSTLPVCCVSFSVPCLLFSFFLWGRGQSVWGAMLVYPRGGCVSTTCCLFAHLLLCISQADLELASGSAGALLVSQYKNQVWRSSVWLGVCSVGVLLILGCFFLPSVAPASQQDFWFRDLMLSASSL